jgi:hypothetical protein
VAEGAELVERGLAAGFPPEEIQAWIAQTRTQGAQAGFSEGEMNAYFGAPEIDPEPIREHFRERWTAATEGRPFDLTFMQALEAGWEQSIIGLLKEQKLPEIDVSDAPRYQRLAAEATTLALDLPVMMTGALIGGAGGAETGPGALITAMGGAFALPAGLRHVLMEKYGNGEIDSWERFWDVLSGAVIAEFKGYVTGATTAMAGLGAARAGAPTAVKFGTELLTMVRMGAALEGRAPEPDEFIHGAILLSGLKGSIHGAAALRRMYANYGKRPLEVIEDAAAEPSIAEDLASRNIENPRAYRGEEKPPEIPPPEPTPEAPAVEGPVGKVLERISVGEEAPGRGWSLDRFYTNWFDRLHPLHQAVRAMREGKDLSVAQDAYRLARLHVGVHAKANHFLEYSPVKFGTFERIGRPLKEILDPVKDNLDEVRAYLVAKRALELSEREIETGVDLDAARGTVRQLRHLEPIRRELKEYQDNVLNYLRDSGILSKDRYRAMLEANRDYVPFFRVMEQAQRVGTGKGLRTKDPVFRIRGSEREIVDPIESIIKNTYLYITLAERNEIAQAFVRLAEESPRGAEFAIKSKPSARRIEVPTPEGEEIAIFRPEALRPGKNQIAVYRDGKREGWNVDPEIAEIFDASGALGAEILRKFLAYPARLLRAGAIWSPEFIARNPFRDQLSAFIFSNAGYRPFVDFTRGVFSLARKDAEYQDWLLSGGPMAMMVSLDRTHLQKGVRQILNQTSLLETGRNVLKSPIEMLATMSEIAEQGTRIGEFKRMTRGKPRTKEAIRQAGFASREVTLDFGRIGARAQAMNQITAFFNAQVQGVDKMVRSFKNHPARTSARVVASVTIPSLILYLLNRDEKGWSEIPQWEKDYFWLIPVDYEDGRVWHRIPKPFEIGVIFGSGVERLAASMLEEDPKAFDEFMETVFRGLTPSFVPTVAVPVIETFANRSIFFDRPIIPVSREKALPQYQYRPYTTELTKAIARGIAQLPNLERTPAASPVLIDNLIRGWSGGLGRHIVDLADKGLREAGVLPDPTMPTDTLADIVFIKGFTVRYPSSGAESIQDFWDDYGKERQVIETIRVLVRDGEPEAAMQEYKIRGFEDHPEFEGILSSVEDVAEAMGQTARFIRLITKNPQLDADYKRQWIDAAQFHRIALAQQGNKMLERVQEIRGAEQ